MRLFAFCILACLLPFLPPTAAADECTTADPTAAYCQKVTANDPGAPSPTRPYIGRYWGTYYVYTGLEACMQSPVSNACRGTPAGQGSTVGALGVLYQESNGLPGLQRTQVTFGDRLVPADRMVVL